MNRKLFNLGAAISLLLAILLLGMWPESYFREFFVDYQSNNWEQEPDIAGSALLREGFTLQLGCISIYYESMEPMQLSEHPAIMNWHIDIGNSPTPTWRRV